MKKTRSLALLILLPLAPVLHSCSLLDNPKKPDVITNDPINITVTTAKTGGAVTDDGNAEITSYGVYWGVNPNPSVSDFLKGGVGFNNDFTCELSGLKPSTKYYYRAFANNSEGTGYGEVKSFITSEAEVIPDIWTAVQPFNSRLWGINVKAADNQNFWMSAIALPDINPIPNLPIHIYKSGDGGNTWTDNIIPGSEGKFAAQLAVFGADNAWINVTGTGLYHTGNAGTSWSLINQSQMLAEHALSIHFFSATEGVARFVQNHDGIANDSIIIIKTYNGGVTWSRIDYYNNVPRIAGEGGWYLGKGFFESIGDTVAFPTDLGRVFMSYDRGNTWKAISYSPASFEVFNSLALISSRKFALTSLGQYSQIDGEYVLSHYPNSKVFATEDGGNSWITPFQLNIYQGLITSIPGQNNLYLVTGFFYNYNGGSYLSTDAGRSFSSIDSLFISLSSSGFSSIHNGVGASLNYNTNISSPNTNYIYKWNPERLFRKKTIPR